VATFERQAILCLHNWKSRPPRQGHGKQFPAAGGGLFDKENSRAKTSGQSGHQLGRRCNVACKAGHRDNQGCIDNHGRT